MATVVVVAVVVVAVTFSLACEDYAERFDESFQAEQDLPFCVRDTSATGHRKVQAPKKMQNKTKSS